MTENKISKAAAQKALAQLDKGGDVARVLTETFVPKTTQAHATAPEKLKVAALTEAHRKAIESLPEVYGSVTPDTPRRLSDEELSAIVDERTVVDTLLTLLKNRKDKSVRETLAYHLDRLAEEEGLVDKDTPTDDSGHYYVKQDVEAPGTGKKVQRIVSDPTPSVSSKMLEDLHKEGVLDRQEYLAITSLPTVARVFDEAKARKAIRDNPALLNKIAQAVTRPTPTITIKVEKAT